MSEHKRAKIPATRPIRHRTRTARLSVPDSSKPKREKRSATRPPDKKAAKNKRRREKIGATRPKLLPPVVKQEQPPQDEPPLESKKKVVKPRSKKPPGPKIKMSVCELRMLAKNNKIKLTTMGAKNRSRYKTRVELFLELQALGLPVM